MLPPRINDDESLDATTTVRFHHQNTGQSAAENNKEGLWWLKNGPILTYLLATTLGIATMTALRFVFMPYRPEVLNEFLKGARTYPLPLILLSLIVIIMFLYERPIRRLLNLGARGEKIPEDLRVKAQRRVLKEPYFVVLLNITGGLGAAVIVVTVNIKLGLSSPISRMGAFEALLVSTITAAVAFFAMEYFLNRWMAPRLFPEGRLHQTSGAWKISLRGRLVALFVAINLIPLSTALLTAYRTADSLELILISLFVTVPLFILAGFVLTMLMAINLTRSMDNLAYVLRDVSRGQFSS